MARSSKKRNVSIIRNVRYPELLIVAFILLAIWDMTAMFHIAKLIFL